MRPSINRLVGLFAETIPCPEPIYEFGSFQVPGQEEIADLRPYFPGRRYVGSDMREGRGVDVVLDLHDLDLPDATIGTAIMIDTLEHVEYTRQAMAEVHRALRDDGVVLMTSVMRFPIHDHPNDFWRFTPEAFRSLLKEFEFAWADHAGEGDFPHTVIGVAAKRALDPDCWARFLAAFAPWKEESRAATWPEWLTPHPPGVPAPGPSGMPEPEAAPPPSSRERLKRVLPDPVVCAIRRAKATARRGNPPG